MSLSSSFHLQSFQQKVGNALHVVERTLELERKPRLAGEQSTSQQHTYGHIFGLVHVTTHIAILAFITCLEKLGLDCSKIIEAAYVVKMMDDENDNNKQQQHTTLRFDASSEWTFIKEVQVTVPMDVSWTENEKNSSCETKVDNNNNSSTTSTEQKTRVMKAVNHVTEFHWEVNNVWTISILHSRSSNVEQQQKQQQQQQQPQQDIIQSRSCETTIITQSKNGIIPGSSSNLLPIELSLRWLLNQIDTTTTTTATSTPLSSSSDEHFNLHHLDSKFKVDMEAQTTKTPTRNNDIEQALEFASQLRLWCTTIQETFIGQHLRGIIEQAHNPAIPQPRMNTINQLYNVMDMYVLFNPILPLMKENENNNNRSSSSNNDSDDNNNSNNNNNNNDGDDQNENENENVMDSSSILLSQSDISKLLNQHVHTLDTAINSIIQTSTSSWPTNDSDNLLSSSEAKLSLILSHVIDLAYQYINSMEYVESMLETQLIRAIGKRITHGDLNQFIIQHNAKLMNIIPRPFSYAIRRKSSSTPVGLLTIEENVNDVGDGSDNISGCAFNCIYTHTREVQPPTNLSVPLNAATVLTLTGRQYLHGYMKYRFGSNTTCSISSTHRLVARARQFSSFILIIGNMTNVSTLDPKDAIIITNKDEIIVSLLMDELPTAKEFTDAVRSLSPEQQRFARAYRAMQLASSVFGVCIIQIKPQMEKLLGLPANSLDKEMKLTQELMELFVEYQIPSDMLSYTSGGGGGGLYDDEDVDDGAATQDKIDSVKENVKNVLDVITAEKEKQLKYEQTKTDMAMESMLQQGMNSSHSVHHSEEEDVTVIGAPSTRRGGTASHNHRRLMFKSAGRPPPMMMMACAAPENSMTEYYANDLSSATTSSQQPIYNDKVATEQRSIHNSSEFKSTSAADQGLDFTVIPQILDRAIDNYVQSNALRSTTIKAGKWSRNRQANLLSNPKLMQLNDDMKNEKNKAFDLLDALSRSGSLSIEFSDLHVIVTVTHCFDKDIMSTVVCDNVNPIEKLELSTLLVASVIHGKSIKELIQDTDKQRFTIVRK